MQFGNPIVGLEELIREAIRSKNFVTGVSGWRIARDGTAEFSAIIIRGSGTADAVVIGPSGLPQVIIRTTPTNGLIVWPTNRPIEELAASATSAAVNPGAVNERAEFQLTGPTVSGANDGVRLIMRSQANDGSSVAEFSIQNKDGSEIFFVVDETEVRIVNRRIDSRQLVATGVVLAGYVTTDAFDRFQILGNGEMQWGPGNAARDTNLYRGAAGVLQTDDTFVVLGELHPRNLVRAERPNATDSQFETRQTADTNARWFMRADGQMWWGPGNAVQDTNLYRSAANVLKTDDDFSAANYPDGAWTSFTPTWTTSTGAALPSYGAATLNCDWTRHGRTITARYEIVFAADTNFGGGGAGDNYRFSLPVTASATHQVAGFLELNQTTGRRCIARARLTTTGALELEVSSGAPDGAAVAGGLCDAITPWVWASGNAIRGILTYEAAS